MKPDPNKHIGPHVDYQVNTKKELSNTEKMILSAAIGSLTGARYYAGESRVLSFTQELLCNIRDSDIEGAKHHFNKLISLPQKESNHDRRTRT